MSPDTSDGPQSPASEAATGPQSPGAGTQAPPPPPGGGLAAPQSPQSAFAAPAAGSVPQLSSVGKRFGSYLLDVVLSIVTLGIGWLVWTLIILGRGQTPAKQLLHMRVVKADTGVVPSYGMMFVREVLAKLVIGIIAWGTIIGLVLFFWPLWDERNQELWDKMVNTVVVEDPDDRLAPA